MNNDIISIIKRIANEGSLIQTYPAKVIRVNVEGGNSLHQNTDAYTVDVMRSDGAEIKNVRLKASIQNKEEGFVCVPKENSWVLVSIIETTETRAFISQYSEVEQLFLRIKKSETEYFQLNTNGANTELLFKEKKSAASQQAEFVDRSKITFSDDQSLNIEYKDTEEKKVLQTTIAQDKVEVNFNEGEGYLAKIDATDVVFKNKSKEPDLTFKMDEFFTIETKGGNLKAQLEMLIDEISKIVVVQGTSPDKGALTEIKGTIAKILN